MKGFVALLLLLSLLIFPVACEESTSGSTGTPAQSSSPAAEETTTPGSSAEETTTPGSSSEEPAAPGSTSSEETTAPDSSSAEEPATPSDTITSAKAYVQALVNAVETNITLGVVSLDLSSQNDLKDFKFRFDIPYEKSVKEAAYARPVTSSVAFFFGILKTESAADAVRLAEACEENADLYKEFCTFYAIAEGEAAGNYVIYVMESKKDRADALIDAFFALAKNAS